MAHSPLPSVEQYLARLPAGIHSHPQAVVKGAVFRNSLAWLPDPKPKSGVPALDRLIDEPPLVSEWVPQVYNCAWNCTIFDTQFATSAMPAWEEWIFARQKQLLRSPLYRALFFVMSPKRMLANLPRLMHQFRRGLQIDVVAEDETSARYRATYPTHLFDRYTLSGLAQSTRAGLEQAGGSNVKVAHTEVSPTEALYDVSWRPGKDRF